MPKAAQDKVDYWLDLADDDLAAAKTLLNGRHLLHAGYFCNLTVEKAFKAAFANNTNGIPPKIHDLQKLAGLSGILEKLNDKQEKLIDDLMPLQIEARYPEHKDKLVQTLTKEYCKAMIDDTEDLLCWIRQQLGR